MFEIDNYAKLVLMAYHQKRADGSLPIGLIYPTPASLRDECLRACQDRFLEKDKSAIKGFFVEGSDSKTFSKTIEQYPLGKFRTIINYLNSDGTINTKDKNVLLLAWLIDFEDRPYEYGKKYGAALADAQRKKAEEQDKDCPEPELIVEEGSFIAEGKSDAGRNLGDGIDEANIKENRIAYTTPEKTKQEDLSNVKVAPTSITGPATDGAKRKRRLQILKAIVVVALLFVIGGGGYWLYSKQGPNEGCMYWAGDHYEPIPCDQKSPYKRAIALDTAKVKNFRKIPSNKITLQSIGRVWYSKINNEVEFFTANGDHPVAFNRHLKPLTELIVNKYGQQDTVSNP
jgi:hypothetical protein